MLGANYLGQSYFGQGPAGVESEAVIIDPIVVVRHPNKEFVVREDDTLTRVSRRGLGSILVRGRR